VLTDQELLRYSRQVLLSQVDIEGQLRLKSSRALIIGLGGLGSPTPPSRGWVQSTRKSIWWLIATRWTQTH
jgi:hypothetical protein